MSATEIPGDPPLAQLWRDPDDGMLKRRYNLGHSCNGKLLLKISTKCLVHLYWIDDAAEIETSTELVLTT